MSKASDYRVIVSIDFGTTYSGFAYTHTKSKDKEIFTHTDWQEYAGRFKTPSVLLYDDDLKSVQSWGFSALAKRPKRKKVIDKKPVELFKLHLGKMTNKPSLPKGLDHKRAITDYLHEFGKVVKNKIDDCWKVNFFTQVLLIFTIPAEFDDNAILIMRECAYKAGLLKDQFARNVKFITEPEAAAVHCMKSFKEHNLSVGANFMIVDCGGGTVDLTTRQLLEGETLSEITERSGDYCGGSFVDQEFLKFLESKVGANAISQVRENHYCQLQYMVQEFVRVVKMKFTGDPSGFEDTELELDEICPVIKQYCQKEYFDKMEEVDWNISLKFDDVKKMFDPIVKKIIKLIDSQLHLSNNNCSAILMVGGFSESKYLQSRIKQEFKSKVKLISIPPQPVIAVIRGAVEYGLREEVVSTRVLKWTYGTDVARKWRDGDPIDRRLGDGRIIAFERLVKRGTQINVNDKVYQSFISYDATQRRMGLDLYVTPQDDAKFCDDPDVKTLGNWSVELPDSTNDDDRSILFTMIFGNVEIDVTAYNSGTEAMFDTKFNLDM
ncbi:unnamed protein product [Rhizophagus irregularis]|uniref:Actin-like ATPase domain-containing protein n=1 Tax=Rhizophagus irregularis TaxID=588596 RepID=A0A2I1FUI5_9GLOM|nr:actin-like ATPase domain-containing protein [Rhizophagus irregularis]CAB4434630.1 unnamed protein product [Rhizophagus irregularis]